MFAKSINPFDLGGAKRFARATGKFAFLFFLVKGLAWLSLPLLLLDFAG